MKKLSVLIAIALLAVAGTGMAVTCAYDNVPGGTLLIPYFKVSGAGNLDSNGNLATGTDTQVGVTNVSATGLIIHITVWNKYSAPVFDFNVPLTGKDVVFFSVRSILNGHLNINPTQVLDSHGMDPCGITTTNPPPTNYTPDVGWGGTTYIRFSNPDFADFENSISFYQDPAITGAFRSKVWDSLDESADINTFTNPAATGILDTKNPACSGAAGTVPPIIGDLTGYITIDVVNYCTNHFPNEGAYYSNNAIATTGWGTSGYTTNALMGDVFYLDGTPNSGNISGDPAVHLEFDDRLQQTITSSPIPSPFAGVVNSFYGRYWPDLAAPPVGPIPFNGVGDARESLGDRYGYRFLDDLTNGLQTWIEVWRSDRYMHGDSTPTSLCGWWGDNEGLSGFTGEGFFNPDHQVLFNTYNNDESLFTSSGAGPSGGGTTVPPPYIFLETQRISLLGNADINPGAFTGGWTDLQLRNSAPPIANIPFNMGWVGVQHTGPGATLSVGYSATLLNNQFLCFPTTITSTFSGVGVGGTGGGNVNSP